ncbi:phosphatase PAP2 family protein [Duganella sp. FT134W]|uniref:Phosphatase PAP2 family protein n=1 Tax=Duganella margarita TaxID=2692170 RepID=A0A7X4GZT3_9BURK|nr:phosphatase PAP2 family protein [Duganella margarita]MYM72732.1 phosphatase PAP2 family protein [Duganella margarita]
MIWWHWLSVIGSLAVTGPIGVAIVFWLLAGKSWRLTAIWLALFGVGMALVVITKMAFMGWGIGVQSVDFAGLSGHAMRAAAVYPVVGFLITRSSPQWARQLGTAAGVVLAVLIAMSRVYVHDHSSSEAITGCILGLLVAAAFIWYASGEGHLALSRVLVVLCLPILLLAPHAEPIPAELWITKAALYLSGRDQPFTRASWHAPRPQLR